MVVDTDTAHNARLTVLVADGNKTIRNAVAALLEPVGCHVLQAEDGFAALACTVENAPDIILADTRMPRLDGFQICAVISGNEQYAQLPVVLLAGKDGIFERARGRLAGCAGFLPKPFTRDQLVATIEVQTGVLC